MRTQILLLLLLSTICASPMLLTFDTKLSTGTTIEIPLGGDTIDVIIDWGDGLLDTVTHEGNVEHMYDIDSVYTVSLSGRLDQLGAHNPNEENRKALIALEAWGDLGLKSLRNAFAFNCNLTSIPNELPETVTKTVNMFRDATAFNCDISKWDVSRVTDMNRMFWGASVFNQDIGEWDVSSVTNMEWMFSGANAFNQDLSRWDVSSVTDMGSMFSGALAFNGAIGSWDVSSVAEMNFMFNFTEAFNQDISGWDVSNVYKFSYMFQGADLFNQNIGSWNLASAYNLDGMFNMATSFNGDVEKWDVSHIREMDATFCNAIAFDRDLSGWDVSNVSVMEQLFVGCELFNADLSGWNVSKVRNMRFMFAGATLFNQNITGWDVSNVSNMKGMFKNAISFAQNIGSWDVSSVKYMEDMFSGDSLGSDLYDSILTGWVKQELRENVEFNAGLSKYNAVAAHDTLQYKFHWLLRDGGPVTQNAVIDTKVSQERAIALIGDQIRFQTADEYRIEVYATNGALLATVSGIEKQFPLSRLKLAAGLYQLRVTQGVKSSVFKVVMH